ncbi:MAG TPA: PKD domain-containing protein [Hanamia sp.]
MTTQLKSFLGIFVAILFFFSGCTKEDTTFGALVTPDKPAITVTLVGKDADNPFGDGSGKVMVSVSSANAFNYKVDFGDGLAAQVSTSNEFNHTYNLPTGNSNLTITATASGTAGISSTNTADIEIYRAFIPDPTLVTMLTGDGVKKWRVDSSAAAQVGVGPDNTFTPDWWAAAPNEKKGLGIYDDIYTFNSDGNMFTHTTNNSLFGKEEYLKDFDPSLSGSGDYTLTGPTAASYTEKFGYDGDANGEYITFSHLGHLGMYLGVHKYQIISRSNTNMVLRCLQDPGAWYVKIIAVQ